MRKRIFLSILLVSIVTMIFSLIFIIGVQHDFYNNKQVEGLKNETYILSKAIEKNPDDIKKYYDSSERITLISNNGIVLFDNRADVTTMENHLKRKEVAEAKNSNEGFSVRFSDTLSKRTCYYAILLKNGSILRVSNNNLSSFAIFLQLLQPICAIIIGCAVFSFILANIISKKLLKPINDIDLDNPEEDKEYEELSPLLSKINQQNMRINQQILKLTQSKKEFEIISDNMKEGLLLTDKKGNIISYNKSTEKFFDVTEDLKGKNILTLNRNKSFRTIFEGILDSKQSESEFEYNKRIYQITGNLVYNEENMLCGAVILIIDITEKTQREKLRREFTANVSHELKTPLTSILGISDMLKNGIVNKEDISGFAGDINKEAERLISLVNDIIKLSNLDEQTSLSSNDTTDLYNIAKEVCERLSIVADKQGIKLECSGESAIINGDESLVFELMYNLTDNAIKYNKENGNVEVITGNKNGKPFITVRDNGIGISEENIERIFERFYRVDKSRSKQTGGTGLGLSIVKHISAVLNGEITVNSNLGVGTEISVLFSLL